MRSLSKDLLTVNPTSIVNLFQELPLREIKELVQWITKQNHSVCADDNLVHFPGDLESLRKLEDIFSGVELYKIKQYRMLHRLVA